jgi:hypothetical protein
MRYTINLLVFIFSGCYAAVLEFFRKPTSTVKKFLTFCESMVLLKLHLNFPKEARMAARISPEVKKEMIIRVVMLGESREMVATDLGVSYSHLCTLCRKAEHSIKYSLDFYGTFPKEYLRYHKNLEIRRRKREAQIRQRVFEKIEAYLAVA